MGESEFDLKTLSARARVTPRTVHFYVQQGLLPPAGSPGPGARYGEGHVQRLRLIRLLQKQHLPLAEIAKRLRGLSDEQVETLVVEARQRRESERGSALDYIRNVLGDLGSNAEKSRPPSRPHAVARSAVVPDAALSVGPTGTESARSQWERFTLTDGMELNVRRPLSRIQQRQLDRILTAARNILGPDEEE